MAVLEACCEVKERTIALSRLLLGYPPSGGGLTAHTAGETEADQGCDANCL